MEVYGTSTGSANADKTAGCKDIKVLVPVGPVDRASFDSTVTGIRASGYTPIGNSLRTAAAALPKEGPRSIVLVSDGEDTCAPPQPCEVAKELKQQGVELTVHTVGFKVNAAARSQLQCIAGATGGTYQDASDGPSLGDRLQTQVQRGLRGYQAQGTPISGSSNAGDAPVLRPGQYVDTLNALSKTSGARETSEYYQVDLGRGETPYFAATLVPPARRPSGGGDVSAVVTMSPVDSNSCSVNGYAGDIGLFGVPASTAVATPESATDRACLSGGPVTVKVTRSGAAFADEPLKVELAYRVEPAADSTGLPVPATEQKDIRPDIAGASTPTESSSSFNDAALLRPGIYRDSFVSGESRYVKVQVGWGQRIAYSLAPTKLPGRGLGAGVFGKVSVAIPVRQLVNQPSAASTTAAFMGSSNEILHGSTLAPVRYTNRTSITSGITGYAVAGDYYLVLSTAFADRGRPALTVPYTLKLSVVGTEERGPVYANAGSSSSPSSSPSSSSSQPPSASGRASASAGASNPSAEQGVRTAAVVGGSAGFLAIVAAAVALILLRRRGRLGAAHDTTAPPNGW